MLLAAAKLGLYEYMPQLRDLHAHFLAHVATYDSMPILNCVWAGATLELPITFASIEAASSAVEKALDGTTATVEELA